MISKIRRVIAWLPVIWKIREWDESYIEEVFLFQLKRTIDHIEKHKYFEGWEVVVQKGRTMIRLAEKVFEEEYELAPFKNIDSNAWPHPMNPEFRQELDKAYEQQKKARTLLWKMVDHYLPYFWC